MKVILYDSFEDGFHFQDGQAPLTVPNEWYLEWVEDPKEGILDRPEVKPEDAAKGDRGVRSGRYGVKLAGAYATFDATLRRTIAVEPEQLVRLEAYSAFYTKNVGNNNTGAMNMQVGIDPLGGIDAQASTVVWGPWIGQDSDPLWKGETFRQMWVETTAKRSLVTLFLRGTCRWPVATNAVYLDDVTVRVPDDPPPLPGTGDTELREALSEAVNQLRIVLDQLEEKL